MTELEKLKAQRKELDKRIKALENPKYEVDGARCYFQKYRGPRPDEWVVRLEEIDNTTNKSAYKQIVSAKTKAEAINYLELQIVSLQNLVELLKEN